MFALRKNMNILRKTIHNAATMLTLTSTEIAELTDRTQPSAQIRWLTAHGWLFEVGGG